MAYVQNSYYNNILNARNRNLSSITTIIPVYTILDKPCVWYICIYLYKYTLHTGNVILYYTSIHIIANPACSCRVTFGSRPPGETIRQ